MGKPEKHQRIIHEKVRSMKFHLYEITEKAYLSPSLKKFSVIV